MQGRDEQGAESANSCRFHRRCDADEDDSEHENDQQNWCDGILEKT